jgi:hypothetical protein
MHNLEGGEDDVSGYAKTPIQYTELPARFAATVKETTTRLLQIDEAASGERRKAGAWSRREILGHLLDSAVNNHLRFARATLEEHYEGPSYQQEGWVRLHRYDECTWSELVGWWAGGRRRISGWRGWWRIFRWRRSMRPARLKATFRRRSAI